MESTSPYGGVGGGDGGKPHYNALLSKDLEKNKPKSLKISR